MKVKTKFTVLLLSLSLVLMTSCTESAELGPTRTPDPLLMTINERTIWDFENLRNDVNDLAEEAAETPAEDLEPIIRQMTVLKEEIEGHAFPLFASQAHSVLFNFALYTEQCFFGKYAEYLAEISDQGTMLESDDRCDQAQVYNETFEIYLQELKEMDADN